MPHEYTEEEREEIAEERGIIVSPEDQWLLGSYTWRVSGRYVVTTLPVNLRPPEIARLHHCIVGQPITGGIEVDHRNGNELDNRRSNLRYLTQSRNATNTERSDNAYYIYPLSNADGYFVQIRRDKKYNYLGTFDTIEAAEAARDKWLEEDSNNAAD